MVARHAPGTAVKVTLLRDKQKRTLDMTLAALKDESDKSDDAQQAPSSGGGEKSSALGIGVSEEDGHVVVGRVVPNGPSDGKLRPGDVIDEIGGQRVTSASDLASKVRASSAGKPILLHVKRGDRALYVAIDTSGKK